MAELVNPGERLKPAHASPGSGAACRGSRTMPCSAARAASSTTSSRSHGRSTPRSCDRSSPTPGSPSTPRPQLAAPGVVGVLTGDDVAALSRPFPAGIDSGVPHYAAAIDTVRYVGEPIAVVVAESRYLAEDAAELVEVDYDPLEPVLDPVAAVPVHERSFSYGDVDGGSRERRRRRPRDLPLPPLHLHPVECYARRRRLGRDRGPADRLGELPGPVHAARRRRGGARTARRPAAAADASRLRRVVRDQVVGVRLRRPARPRRPPARRARQLDGGPARAPRRERRLDGSRRPRSRRASPPTAASSRSATTRSRTSAPTCARPSPRRCTGCTGRSPAPTASRTSPRATASSSRTRFPPASTAASADRSSTSRSSGRWRSRPGVSASTRPSSPAAISCPPRRCPTGRRPGRSTTPATSRRASTTHSSSPATRSCARGSTRCARGPPGRNRARLRRRAVDLEHGLHHARPDGRRARRGRCRSPATPRVPRS